MRALKEQATQRLLWLCQDWSRARGQIEQLPHEDPSLDGVRARMEETARRAAERKQR